MSKEAMKLALEALKEGDWYIGQLETIVYSSDDNGTHGNRAKVQDAIKALEEALAKQEQGKPVAWGMEGKDGFIFDVICHAEHEREEGGYTTPLYTTPPQRKPLTDEEIGAILEGVNAYGTRLYTFARAIEAAHGIKE